MVLTLDSTQALTPVVAITINGVPLESLSIDASAALVSVVVRQDITSIGMFSLKFVNRDLISGLPTWVDDALFNLGNRIEVSLGYQNRPEPLILGEITGLEPEFSLENVSTLTVHGHDLRHRLMRGHKTRPFVMMTDSAIASQIAKEAGIVAQATNTNLVLDYVLQHNQSDWAFLQTRANRLGYEIAMDGSKLLFRPHQHQKTSALTLRHKEDQFEFIPRMNSLTQTDFVEVNGWDPKKKSIITGQFLSKEQPPEMKGTSHGPQATTQAFGASQITWANQPIFSSGEAKQIAQGQFTNMALDFIIGEGISQGRPQIQAGKVMNIEGIGTRFSGTYYITTATHTYYTRKQGYHTAFIVRRNST